MSDAYGYDGQERLCDEIDEVVQKYLEEVDRKDLPATLVIYGFRMRVIDPSSFRGVFSEHWRERMHDWGYMDPDAHSYEDGFDLEALRAAEDTFLKACVEATTVFDCERDGETHEIDLAAWIAENNYYGDSEGGRDA